MALFNIFLNEGAIKAATMAFTVSSAINGMKPAINAALKLISPIIIIHKVPKRSTNTAETIAAIVKYILLYVRLQTIGSTIAIITKAKEYPPY